MSSVTLHCLLYLTLLLSITLSSIQSINGPEYLQSDLGLECESFQPAWIGQSNTTGPTIETYDGISYRATGPWRYTCYPGIKFHRKKLYPLSKGGMVGIGLGIGIPLVLFIAWWVNRRGNRMITMEVEKRRQEIELAERRSENDAPPIYVREGERGGDVVVGVSGDSSQRPPEYQCTTVPGARTEVRTGSRDSVKPLKDHTV